MFDEPGEDPAVNSLNPDDRAREKSDELRTHAELAAVFEGTRKFEAELLPGLDPELAREIQRTMALLAKARAADSPIVPEQSATEAAGLLSFPETRGLSTNDYHIHRRPGEVMIVRWVCGEEVETFYKRIQAHFDAGLSGLQEDERQALEWKKDPKTAAYLIALDSIKVRIADRYLRDAIRRHKIFVLSTQTADEINIAYLTDHIMGATASDLVGPASATSDDPTEQDLAWFFKLFALRGIVDGIERMCFFTFLQKTDDTFDLDG